jgi:mono/diheme cytochrome c family protein
VPGTIAQGELEADDALYRGKSGDQFVTRIPLPVTLALMRRGQERFDIYCATCHGYVGLGDGMTAKRADALQEGTWTPPTSLHTDPVRQQPVGQIFNTITYGIRKMPPYGPLIPVRDRWAIVLYVRALERSQNARVEDVPPEVRPSLK